MDSARLGLTYRLFMVRFVRNDVRLWTDPVRIRRLDAESQTRTASRAHVRPPRSGLGEYVSRVWGSAPDLRESLLRPVAQLQQAQLHPWSARPAVVDSVQPTSEDESISVARDATRYGPNQSA